MCILLYQSTYWFENIEKSISSQCEHYFSTLKKFQWILFYMQLKEHLNLMIHPFNKSWKPGFPLFEIVLHLQDYQNLLWLILNTINLNGYYHLPYKHAHLPLWSALCVKQQTTETAGFWAISQWDLIFINSEILVQLTK